ncbi:hypothetical protein L228DRAFT_283072 [Xylona heveae TC161]|uniref:Uncharacterized protein n=1 Tax=Xylona heveae (strain CBS 132557 / TC161) TaxID=1328760 RepID=A0A165H5I2_XYLHT|nr:hypothetical protein L228DRAFT_283072 [Xylona heveae TC161]KZF23013.1 hypothetical protein L228DRAFT_283072 [Xylona heveae TC161]
MEASDMIRKAQVDDQLRVYRNNLIVAVLEKRIKLQNVKGSYFEGPGSPSKGVAGSPNKGHSTTRQQQFAKSLTVENLRAAKIPVQNLPILHKADRIIRERNQAAHDTTVSFARLLMAEEERDPEAVEYELWADLFLFLQGKTIPEVAAEEEEEEALVQELRKAVKEFNVHQARNT